VQLVSEVVNAEFIPDGDYAQTEFDLCKILPLEEPQGGAHNFLPSEAQQILEGLNKGGVWYDSGGPTKESKRVRECNGSPVWVRIKKYGLLGSSIGAYSRPNNWLGSTKFGRSHTVKSEVVNGRQEWRVAVLNLSADALAGFWGNFSDVTEYTERDSAGYCTARYQVGWTLYRFRTESSAEAAQTYVEEAEAEQEYLDALSEGDAEKIAELVAALDEIRGRNNLIRKAHAGFYLHQYTRENSRIEYQLASLANHYADLRYTRQNPHKYCKIEIAISNWLATMPDPSAFGQEAEEGESPALLSVGERYEKRKITKIAIPAGRGDLRKPERFSVEQRETNAEGAEFKDRITLSPATYSEGRPTEHDRVITYGWSEGALPFPATDPAGRKTLILNSPGTGYSGTEPPQGEWSSAGVWLQSQAIAAMNLELSIDNTQNAKTTTLTIPSDLSIVEGDTLLYKGERWIVLGLSLQFRIEQGVARCETQECSVGRMMAFGGLWEDLYPTEEDYPPDTSWPGAGNAPTAVSVERTFTFAENAATLPLSSGVITATILIQHLISPATLPLSSGVITATIPRQTAAAIIPLSSGAITSSLVAFAPFQSALIPITSGTLEPEDVVFRRTGFAEIPLSSGEITSTTLEFAQIASAAIPLSSGTIASEIAIFTPTLSAGLPFGSGEIVSEPLTFTPTLSAEIPLTSGVIEPEIT
jgi:hypothetical protein